MLLPFCGPTYQGRSVNIDASRAVNLYPELTGTQDNKAQMAMVGTPGLLLFTLNISAGSNDAVRGMYTFNNVIYVVAEDKLFSGDTGGTFTYRGTLTTTTGRVGFSSNGVSAAGIGGDQLMVVDGANGYIYNIGTHAFSTIASAGGWADLLSGGGPTQVEFIDGYFIASNSTMAYWVSNLYDGLTWGALATSPVSATSDNIQGLINHRQQLFCIKEWATEVWYDAGTPTSQGSPFSRVSGAVYDFGTMAPWSLAKGGASFYFLCTNRTADGGEFVGVAEITEYSPVIISPPAINWYISQSTTLVNCFGYCYSDQGHMFYVLTNPDDNWTIVYDASTKMWHERSSLGTATGDVNRHLGNCYTYFNNKHYIGDYRNSNVYEMSHNYLTDNGNEIYAWRTAQTIQDTNMRDNMFINRLVVDAETGIGTDVPVIITVTPYPAGLSGSASVLILADGSIRAGARYSGVTNPVAYLSWSNDAGHTWSSEYECSLGVEADYTARLAWRRLGKARDRVFRIAVKDAVKRIFINAYIEAGT